MKKIFRSLLGLLLVVGFIFNCSLAYGAGTKYAYSIGVNHVTDTPLEGDFTENVLYAANVYGGMSGFSSYYNNFPKVNYMLGNNPKGNRMISSDVVFLNGHGNYTHMAFNAGNKGGDFATGVYFGNDYKSHTHYQYVGLKDTNMSTCDHISFVGCNTAKTTKDGNLPQIAVNQGATSALGFAGEIYSRTKEGKGWLRRYNDYLALGYSIKDAVRNATADYPTSVLGGFSKIYGLSTNTITSSKSKNIKDSTLNHYEVNDKSFDFSKSKTSVLIKERHPLSKINTLLQFIDPDFDLSSYKITENKISESDNSGMYIVTYYIDGVIKTDRAYIVCYDNGKINNIIASEAATKVLTDKISIPESKLSLKANAYLRNNVQSLSTDSNYYKTDTELTYFYGRNELVATTVSYYHDPAEDNAIVDVCSETVLN